MGKIVYDDAVAMLKSGAYDLVTYNSCYGGGPHLSDRGKEMLKVLQGEQPGEQPSLLTLRVVHELGVEIASGKYSRFSFALVGKGLEKYINMNEYDGMDHPRVCQSRMIQDEVENVLEARGVITKDEYNVIKSVDVNLTVIIP